MTYTNKPNPGDEIQWVIRGTVLEDSKPGMVGGFWISAVGDGGLGICTRYIPYSGDWKITKKAERFKVGSLYKTRGAAYVFRYDGLGHSSAFTCVLSRDSRFLVDTQYDDAWFADGLTEIEL